MVKYDWSKIRRAVNRKANSGKTVTMKDIVNKYGVAISTLSYRIEADTKRGKMWLIDKKEYQHKADHNENSVNLGKVETETKTTEPKTESESKPDPIETSKEPEFESREILDGCKTKTTPKKTTPKKATPKKGQQNSSLPTKEKKKRSKKWDPLEANKEALNRLMEALDKAYDPIDYERITKAIVSVSKNIVDLSKPNLDTETTTTNDEADTVVYNIEEFLKGV